MLSMSQSVAYGSSNRSVAVYKGLTVSVYSVDKPELSLTRQDLIELVNVRIMYLLTDLFTHQHWRRQLWGTGARAPPPRLPAR